MPAGRPPVYDRAAVIDIVCGLIAQGKSLVTICKLPDMPDYSTITRWLQEDEKTEQRHYCNMYARAREDQADYLADEIIAIADDDSLDMAFSEEGKPFVDKEHINRSRLRVDARKWVASKLKPKKYGDKIEQTLQSPDGKALELTVNFVTPTKKAD